SGYSEIGITGSASSPATKMRTERTPAKIGRSMKNLEIFMGASRRYSRARSALHDSARALCIVGTPLGLAVHADQMRRDEWARAHALQPVDDDALARLQATRDHAQAVDRRAQHDLAIFRFVVAIDHHHEPLV